MNTLQDLREAQQMWEYKFQNAGREGIVLSDGKPRSLITVLQSIFHKIAAKLSVNKGNLRDDFQPV